MKKTLLCFLLLISIALNCIGCGSDKKSSQPVANEVSMQAVKESGLCNVSIEPNVELLGVVQYLADDPNIIKSFKDNDSKHFNEIKYSNDISKYFSKYKNEPVVDFYKQMNSKGFSYDIPPSLMLYVDGNLKLLNNITLPDRIIQNSGGKEDIVKFLNLLADFRKKSKFDEFYNDHTGYYKAIVSITKSEVDKIGCIDKIKKYYGYDQNSYNIIIQTLSIGGYGVWVSKEDEKEDAYDFMVVPDDCEEFAQLLTHEFSHSYINPLTKQNINEVNKYSNLYEPIKESMSKQAYSYWEECVNEHIVRAVTYRIIYDLYGADASNIYIDEDTSKNFIYLKALSERLEEYEKNRDKYPNFKDFYPRLIDVFKELSDKQPVK